MPAAGTAAEAALPSEYITTTTIHVVVGPSPDRAVNEGLWRNGAIGLTTATVAGTDAAIAGEAGTATATGRPPRRAASATAAAVVQIPSRKPGSSSRTGMPVGGLAPDAAAGIASAATTTSHRQSRVVLQRDEGAATATRLNVLPASPLTDHDLQDLITLQLEGARHFGAKAFVVIAPLGATHLNLVTTIGRNRPCLNTIREGDSALQAGAVVGCVALLL